MKKLIILFIILFNVSFSYTVEEINADIDKLFTFVSDTHDIKINNEIKTINLRELLRMTLMVESNYGRDNYKGRIAKTPFQLEPNTGKHYKNIVPELKTYIESCIGRKLNHLKDRDSVYVAYIIYMSKFTHHRSWVDKFSKSKYYNHDNEWFIYKIYWNSIVGATSYSKWEKRRIELIKMEKELYSIK